MPPDQTRGQLALPLAASQPLPPQRTPKEKEWCAPHARPVAGRWAPPGPASRCGGSHRTSRAREEVGVRRAAVLTRTLVSGLRSRHQRHREEGGSEISLPRPEPTCTGPCAGLHRSGRGPFLSG